MDDLILSEVHVQLPHATKPSTTALTRFSFYNPTPPTHKPRKSTPIEGPDLAVAPPPSDIGITNAAGSIAITTTSTNTASDIDLCNTSSNHGSTAADNPDSTCADVDNADNADNAVDVDNAVGVDDAVDADDVDDADDADDTDDADDAVNAVDEDGDLVLSRPTRCCFHIHHHHATPLRQVGRQVWNGACLLAEYCIQYPDQLAGTVVLEFGAGVGLASVAAASCGARVVFATDVDEGALGLAVENAAANAVHHRYGGEVVRVRRLDLMEVQDVVEGEFKHVLGGGGGGSGGGGAAAAATGGDGCGVGVGVGAAAAAAAAASAAAVGAAGGAGTGTGAASACSSSSAGTGAAGDRGHCSAALDAQAMEHQGREQHVQEHSLAAQQPQSQPHPLSTPPPPPPPTVPQTATTLHSYNTSAPLQWTPDDLHHLSHINIFLAADIVYDDQLTEAFVKVARTMMTLSARTYTTPPVLLVAVEKRYNFTIEDMDATAPAYDHFLRAVERHMLGPRAAKSDCVRFECEKCDLEQVPKRISEYDRSADMELWRVTCSLV